ncbi:MAG: fatty oxidation complex subunit alpha, partial [Desulfuromonadales bacterium]|nr:fatty oxidation complex subunit alpha [Desulfuromonadales bacterium]NIR34154.1 fatty oxidation complex subunit alpha [Desulfuromonadales bacterium]NIS40240.1 fatty oxidation complex subunit alpha [Desulfuromonadales bacterium]
MASVIHYEIEDEIAVVTLDAPGEKVNVLNETFLRQLEDTAKELAQKKGLKGAVVVSGKKSGFIAGADIRQIEGVDNPEEGRRLARQGQNILKKWGEFTFPVVCAIHGHCMGGGTEFALACNYRIASSDASVALPEIKLGILPGFGGTQRLPRLISLEKALDIILTGRTVRGAEAERLGIVDRLCEPGELRKEALKLVRDAARAPKNFADRRKNKTRGLRALLLEKNPIGRAVLFSIAGKNMQKKTGGHYPAPARALEVIREGIGKPFEKGLEIEAKALGELITTPESKNLIHIYNLSQRAKKTPFEGIEPTEIKRAAVLGAGVMGGGIAQLLAAKNIPVILKDIKDPAVESGLDSARKIFSKKLKRQGKDESAIDKKMELITGTTEYKDFDRIDLVIEAVLEKMSVKQAVLKECEPLLPDSAVFATNTSALSVSELQSASNRPQQVGGMHFFNPVDKMPLVEIIRGKNTSDQTVATLFKAAANLGKIPVVAADRPGFLVNRLLVTYLNEACLIAEDGVDWPSLDKITTDFGLPMGPFRLIDEVGIDIGAEVGKTLCHAFDHLQESSLMRKADKLGLLGKKGGKGFYTYQGGHSSGPNLNIDAQLDLQKERNANDD